VTEIQFFWVVAPCRLVNVYKRLEGALRFRTRGHEVLVLERSTLYTFCNKVLSIASHLSVQPRHELWGTFFVEGTATSVLCHRGRCRGVCEL